MRKIWRRFWNRTRCRWKEGLSSNVSARRSTTPDPLPPRLNEIIRPGETVCIVISDVTRSWQAPKSYLPILVEELGKIGVRDDQILIISATGTHRAQTEAEWKSLIGESLYARIRTIDHDCRQKEQMRYVGTTSRGTPVWLNRAAA